MPLVPYLAFEGDCEAAFALYERVLGAARGDVFRYGGSPMATEAPAGWDDRIIPWQVNCAGAAQA